MIREKWRVCHVRGDEKGLAGLTYKREDLID